MTSPIVVPGRDRRSYWCRLLAAGLIALAIPLGPWWASARGQAARQDGGPVDLLTAAPFDRLTLVDGTVWIIEPVSPRPLPPYDPAKDKGAEKAKDKDAKERRPPPEGNIGLPKRAGKKEEQLNEIVVHLPNQDPSDFRLRRANIKSLEYFEDMLLAEGKRLIRERDYPRAFEHYLRVQRHNPDWRGLQDHVNELLFEEASYALHVDDDRERGLRLLMELRERQPDYPGLADELALAYGTRIEEAFHQGAFRQARRILHNLDTIAPGHRVGRQWRETFTSKAKGLVDSAARQPEAVRLDRLTEALRVWPTLDGLAKSYEEAFAALPTLDVAVIDAPRPFGPWVRSPADERTTRLVYAPILATADEDATRGRRSGQLAAGLEVGDLGRRLTIRVRDGLTWSDGNRPVTAVDVARALEDRTNPASPNYQARWASLLDRIEAADERQVEVRLTRPSLKPEAWLLHPIGPAHASLDGLVPTADGRRAVGDGLYLHQAPDETSITFLAVGDRSSTGPKVRRIRERRLPDAATALGALVRGEVSLVERVPPDRVAALAEVPGIRIGTYAQLSLHRIALDGRHSALRNRTLRRGLSYAIDRRTLLEETLLRRPIDAENAPSDGPFARGSYANAPDVRPLEHDPLLARLLINGARKELGGAPITLTFEYPATPEARAIVPRIVAALRDAGIDGEGKPGLEIKPVERPETDLERELRSGRRFDLAYRAGPCAEPTLDAGPSLCPGYDAPAATNALAAIASPRSLQTLLLLERAPEWPSARELVLTIDRESRDELPVIPLWQLRDHYAWRSRLKGPGETADGLYQGIETWEIAPWFANDPWTIAPRPTAASR